MITQADLDRAYNHILQTASLEFDELKDLLTDPAPNPVPPGPTGVKLKTAVHRYLVTGPKPAVDFNDLQLWDGFRRADFPGEVYLYISTAEVTGDKAGWTWPIPPGLIKDAYRAHRSSTTLVTRGTGNDVANLLNLTNPDLVRLIVDTQVRRMQVTGADGTYLDEMDKTWEWGWGYAGPPREYPTLDVWRDALANLVEQLAAGLHAVGKKLWINLGADYSATDPWQRRLIAAADGFNIEHFVGREAVGQPPSTTATDWVSQTSFVRDVEGLGKQVHVHASTKTQSVVDYAYVSWLLCSEFRGSFTASGLVKAGSSDYSGTLANPSPSLVTAATALGLPQGGFGVQTSGLRSRAFAHGTLTVNPRPDTSVSGIAPGAWRIA